MVQMGSVVVFNEFIFDTWTWATKLGVVGVLVLVLALAYRGDRVAPLSVLPLVVGWADAPVPRLWEPSARPQPIVVWRCVDRVGFGTDSLVVDGLVSPFVGLATACRVRRLDAAAPCPALAAAPLIC